MRKGGGSPKGKSRALRTRRAGLGRPWGRTLYPPVGPWGQKIGRDPPLFVACYNGNLDIAKMLVKNGADINRADMYGETALLVAIERGHLDVARLLMDHGAANTVAHDGRSPLSIATQRGILLVVERLTVTNLGEQGKGT